MAETRPFNNTILSDQRERSVVTLYIPAHQRVGDTPPALSTMLDQEMKGNCNTVTTVTRGNEEALSGLLGLRGKSLWGCVFGWRRVVGGVFCADATGCCSILFDYFSEGFVNRNDVVVFLHRD